MSRISSAWRCFVGATLFTTAISVSASYIGDSFSISGAPFTNQNSAVIDQFNAEVITPSRSTTYFFCGNTRDTSFICGFVSTPNFFSLEVSETATGDLLVNIAVAGFAQDISVSLNGLDSPSKTISSISVLSESLLGFANFVDPNTSQPLAPQPNGGLGLPSIANAINLSSTPDSVFFSLVGSGYVYDNSFSLLVSTTSIPLPVAIWLFLSAVGGLLELNDYGLKALLGFTPR